MIHEPEAIFYNAVIHTMDRAFSTASTLAVRGQNLVYAGNSPDEAASRLSPGAKRFDLGGKTVVPGLIEGHMHFLLEGQRLQEANLGHQPKEAILRIVAEEAAGREPGEWVLGRGWNNEDWTDKGWPCKQELDAVAPRNPVALTRVDGHAMWVNSPALQAAGIGADTPDPSGGEIVRAENGDPQGILIDTPIFKVWAKLPVPSEAQVRHAYSLAERELFACGVTSLDNASQTLRQHEMLANAFAAGELKIRVYEMLAGHTGQDVEYLRGGGTAFMGRFGERLSVRAIKIIGDGSLGSRSAWLLHDYADRPGHTGNGRYTDEELATIMRRARDNGFQVCSHAIGSASAHQTVNVMERVLTERVVPDHRFRIEHFQIVTREDLRRALNLGIIPSMQTIHEPADRDMAKARLSPQDLELAYNWRGVIDAGGAFINGSDAPMESVNPFRGMHAACARPEPERRLIRLEALASYTSWAAFAEFGETRKGSLEPGKLADFAVLDRDPLNCPVEELRDTKVLLTVVGGEIVHEGAA